MLRKFWAILLAFVMLFALAAPAQAAQSPLKVKSSTFVTDTMKTNVYYAVKGNGPTANVVCFWVKTGPGRTRTIDAWNGGRHVVRGLRVRANSSTGCTPWTFQAKGSTMQVRVQEDIFWRFKLSQTKTLWIW